MNKNDKKFFLFIFLFGIIIIKNIQNSMFPNSYQWESSKTDIKTRGISHYNLPLIDAQMNTPLQNNQDQGITILGVFMGTESINQKENNFGCGFSIGRKNTMIVAGDNITEGIPNRDIRAEYVGGNSNTNATMSLCANQKYYGAKILAQFPLEKLLRNCFFKDWFFSIRTSIVNLQQQLKMTLVGNPESLINNIYNFFSKITENAKIDNQVRSNTGFENITLTLDGIYKNHNQKIQLYYYTGIEIPTNLTYSTPYLFYPYLGNNGNLGFLLGADFHGYFYDKNKHHLGFLLELENHFLLYKTTNRVFDLFNQNDLYYSKDLINSINKPWSRYLPAYSMQNPNIEARVSKSSNLPVRVHECNVLDISIGAIYYFLSDQDTKWYLAGGYNLWMAQPDYIELQDRIFPEEYQNFYNYGILGSLPNTTSSQSTISHLKENDINLENFTFNTLDCGSCAADGSYSQTVFLRSTIIGCNGYNILFGGWYEMGKPKMAPSRIGAWLGGGYEF